MRGHRATRAPFGATATAPVTPPGTDVRLEGVSAVVRTAARAESRSPPGDDDASSSAMASTSAASAGARLSPEGDLELSARAKRELQRHLRRVHARINDSAQAKEASEKMREYVRERRVRAERALARKPGRLAAPPKTYEVGGDNRDAVRQAAARALAAGVRRRTPDTAAALAEGRRDARLAPQREIADADATTEDDDRREGEADRIDRRSRRSRRATRRRSSRRRGDVLRRRRRRGMASCAIFRARESERRREDAYEKPRGDEEPPSVRLEMTMAGRRRLSRLGRW